MSVRHPLVAVFVFAAASAAHATPVEYAIDPQHTFPTLEFPHMGISVWRGRFDETSGRVVIDREAKTGTVEVRVATGSIDFGLDSMHEFAVTPDWLDVAKHPAMTYRGTLVFEGDAPVAVDGALTLRGVTKPLKLTIRKFGCLVHPMEKRERCGADAEGELDRSDWGMSLHTDDGAGRLTLRIQVEALRAEETAKPD